MGAGQSQDGQVISEGGDSTTSSGGRAGGILVVNPTPNRQADSQQQIILPRRVPPVLSIEGNSSNGHASIDPKRHRPERDQLRPQLWTDLSNILGEFAASRAQFVATRQNLLQEKVVALDGHVQTFTDSYVNEKHKALARMNDDCKRLEELDQTLAKCTLQSELCVSMLNKLNFLLPDGEKLEPLE